MSRDDGERPPSGDSTSRRRAGSTVRRAVDRVSSDGAELTRRRVRDVLAMEEPLEIVVRRRAAPPEPIAVTMRTPGADFDLVAGFLFAEGAVEAARQIASMRYCPGAAGGNEQLFNRVEVRLEDDAPFDPARHARSGYTTSSCGVCSMPSIDAVLGLDCPAVQAGARVSEATLLSLPARLRQAQTIFERTGGLHAAALFDDRGVLVRLREDVGRHNAMDKLVGSALLAGELPLHGAVVLLSGRLSFELVQKAARAGVAVLAGVSAPSSLAVELAERSGMTLVGFLRESSFNVYAGGGRVGDGPIPRRRSGSQQERT